jgi:DNA-binding GntR family transcriptional regulator
MDAPVESRASRYSLSQQVRNHILNKVATGEIAPGDKIVEARIAAELNVSTIPVREAIRELAAMRVLDYEVHRGARLREVTVSETIVKAVLEALAAKLAGEKLTGVLEPLRRSSKRIQDTARRSDWVGYQDQNQIFHRLIVEAAGNQILLDLWDTLAFDVRTRFIMDFLGNVDPTELAEEHEQIVRAVEKVDANAVSGLLSSHANGLVEYLTEQKAVNDALKDAGSPD